MKKNPVLSHVVGVLLACLACLHASAREASGQLAVSAWPTFQHDLRHTGQSTFNGPASVTLKWTYQGFAPLKSAPAIGTDGTIYFPTIFGKLYALNPGGSVRWTFKAGQNIKYSAPSIAADGTIYVGTEEALAAVNPDGTFRSKFPTAGRVFSSAAIATDGTIY